MHIHTNHLSIHYELSGPEDAPVITMSHSLAANLSMWDWQMPVLSEYRVLGYDTRGHGETEVGDEPYSLDLLADDLFSLLDALNILKTHLVGLSMGGMIAQVAATRKPERFQSLVLCDTTSLIPVGMRPIWEERIATATERGMAALVESTIERWFSKDYQLTHKTEVDKVRTMIANTPVPGFVGCASAISRLDVTDALSMISLPTLLIVGEDDPGTPVSAHEVIRDQISGSELVVLPNALHFSNVECVSEFNHHLCRFLNTHAR